MKKKRITASELMAQLNADPEFLARKKERDEAFQRKEQDSAEAELPLVKELRSAGLAINSVWDLVNDNAGTYPQALPILLDHLQRSYPDAIRDGIARALAVPAAKFAWDLLVRLYRQERENRTKHGLAVALSNIVDDETLDELIVLARDPGLGESRILLLGGLEGSHHPDARKALMELGTDPQLRKEVQAVLRRLKAAEK